MTTQKTILYQISSRAWEHPADRAALNSLKKVPGLDKLLSMLFGATSERSLRLMYLASAVRVSDKQFARVKVLFDEVCKTFDIEKKPEVYVSQSEVLNAFAVGMDSPFIVLNSALVERFDDEEIRRAHTEFRRNNKKVSVLLLYLFGYSNNRFHNRTLVDIYSRQIIQT